MTRTIVMLRAIAMTGKDVVIRTCLGRGDDTSQRRDTNRRDCISRGDGTNRGYDTSNRDDTNKRDTMSRRE